MIRTDLTARYHYFNDGKNGDRNREIYELRRMGYTQREIATAFGMSHSRVQQIDIEQQCLVRWQAAFLSRIASSIRLIAEEPVHGKD